ncbi:SDR family NAD(P)-dependent oxidoreductase [Haliangium sp.]|uniref:SDR family NAD(P)-dependent oxidoreductase n=1 Tax=Haliangium sp. TaxID=2663208 RepID=UPI003D116113
MAEPSGYTALVTGASAGLGCEFARLFAADGHDVVLVARRRDRLDELANELEGTHGITTHVLTADLVEPSAPQAVYDQLTGDGVAIEFLVNNAGFGSNGPFIELDPQRELDMITVNVTALTHLTRLFVPAMVARGHGRVLNMGSTAGFQAGPYMATYYASKAFVNHLSEALAYELKDTGVTVTVSCPGPVATEFGGLAGNDRSKLFASAVAQPEDIARQAYRAMMKGTRMIVHGSRYKALVQGLRISPRGMIHGISARLNRKPE